MNENIKKLMLEAGYAAPEIAMRAQKLAELIIQECACFVDTAISEGGADGRAVKEHFGVEE